MAKSARNDRHLLMNLNIVLAHMIIRSIYENSIDPIRHLWYVPRLRIAFLMSSITLFKEQRYDRQLRLWGDRGQEILGKSTVCVLGSGAVGTELLKNLVLPGIGGFTIVDDAIVARKDLGSKFVLRFK